MALPKLETPVYTLNLPSTDEEIKFRPFLVKEQKRIMMAQESDDVNETIDTINQLISDCTFNKIDTKKLAMFDAEYIFLQVRSKSVGSKVELSITCPDDEKTKVLHTVDLDEINISVFDDHTNEVQLTENIKVFFKYPLLSTFAKYSSKGSESDMIFKLIEECIEEVHFEDEITNRVDMSDKELNEFVESLSTDQFMKMTKFFETMPRLRHTIEVKNPKTEVFESDISY